MTDSKKIKVLFLAFTSKTYKHAGILIDRPDLTRKMSCLETWVPRIEELGHEVLFFDGNNKELTYDKKNKVLHTTEDDGYDYPSYPEKAPPSKMFKRLQAAVKWSLQNKEFDFIFRTDDGTYINAFTFEKFLQEYKDSDFTFGDGGGGAGILLSKKTCELLINFENPEDIWVEDQVLSNFFNSQGTNLKVTPSPLLHYQYTVGENLVSLHYTNGRRMYFVDTVISYYHNNNPLDRKVVINFPILPTHLPQENSWDTPNPYTPAFYSFIKDKYNWEHYGKLTRSNFEPRVTCPFAPESIKELLLFDVYFDLNSPYEISSLESYIKAVKQNGTLFLYYSDSRNNLLDKFQIYFNTVEEVDYIDCTIEHLTGLKGKFFKLKK